MFNILFKMNNVIETRIPQAIPATIEPSIKFIESAEPSFVKVRIMDAKKTPMMPNTNVMP